MTRTDQHFGQHVHQHLEQHVEPAAPSLPFHRLAHAVPQRRRWWRPVVAVGVAALVYVAMFLALMILLLLAGEIWPAFATSPELDDPLSAADQIGTLGVIALMIPAVVIGTMAGYGRAGIVHSVLGRVRWTLLGRVAIVVLPLYVLLNTGSMLLLRREEVAVPPLEPSVLIAFLAILVLSPLQSAGEEYAFRALPMQMLGTWMRTPVLGILLPVPLFVLGHGYDWVGQIDIAAFALAMGMLAWKTGGLELPILLHAANNLTLYVVAPLIPSVMEQGAVHPAMLLQSTVPMLLITAAIWWWCSRREGLGLWEPQRSVAARAPGAGTDPQQRGQGHDDPALRCHDDSSQQERGPGAPYSGPSSRPERPGEGGAPSRLVLSRR